MGFKRHFRKNLLILWPLVALISCSSNQYQSFNVSCENANITFADGIEKNAGNVYNYDDIQLLYSISKLEKENKDAFGYKHIFNPLDYESNNPKMLVLPLHFSDGKGTSSNERNEIKENLMQTFMGDSAKTGWFSLKDFYRISSDNLINFDISFADFYSCGKSSKEINSIDKVIEVINNGLSNLTINGKKPSFSEFDSNNDGIIDSLWVVYDVLDYKQSSSTNSMLWNFTYPLYNSPYNNPYNIGSFSWGTYNLMYQGADNGIKFDAHTFVHETGHLFGLNDYYDYGGVTAPMCGLTMMDQNVCDFDAYSKLILGWKQPIIAYGNCTINVNDIKNGHPLVILPDESTLFSKDGKIFFNPFSEFLLVEYFDTKNELNLKDIKNGYDIVGLDANKISTDGEKFKVYHVNNCLLEIKKDREYKISVEPFNAKKVIRYVENTTISGFGKSEIEALNACGIKNFPEDINLLNEVTWVAKSTNFENNYGNLYIKEDEESGGKYLALNEGDYYFKYGDVFAPAKYSNYFKNSKNANKLLFDNGKYFSTTINF